MSKSEHYIQNEARNALAGECFNFRANVGQAWQGDAHRLPNGDILLKNPRPFSTGLPQGFSDTFGMTPTVITPDMVGYLIGWAHYIEFKTPTGKPTPRQSAFINAMKASGARAGVARSVEDALAIATGPWPMPLGVL